jgi:hypothetical protein
MFPRQPLPGGAASAIVLSFNLSSNETPSKFRINVTNFIRLTYKLSPQAVVRFVVAHKINGVELVQQRNTSLETLRKDCFLLLSAVLKQNLDRAAKDCPDIWINGEGHVIEAIYPGSATADRDAIANSHSSLGTE